MSASKFNPEKAGAGSKKAATMPRRQHSSTEEAFSYQTSAVLRWLTTQPEVLRAMFDFYRSNGAIVFDPVDGTWRGAETA